MRHYSAGLIPMLLLVLATATPADDDSHDILEQRKELERIQQDIDDGQHRLDSLQSEQKRVTEAISQFDQRIASDRQVLRRLTREFDHLKADISRGDSLLQEYRQMYERRQRRYLGNIRQFYSLAKQPVKAFGDYPNEELEYQRKIIYLSALADYESETVQNASDLVDRSADELSDMSGRQKTVSGLKKKRETAYALGQSQKERQEKNLDQIRRKSMAEADRIITLRQAAQEMQDIIARLEEARVEQLTDATQTGPSAFAALMGQLLSPFRGQITLAFGEHVDPVTRLRSFSPGITIEGRAHGGVYAVASGMVAYTGNLRGYGDFVIINHDHQYYSTYAGLGEILVSEGQFVPSRSKLGTSGQDGVVRFELRNGREALDPVKWIRIESL